VIPIPVFSPGRLARAVLSEGAARLGDLGAADSVVRRVLVSAHLTVAARVYGAVEGGRGYCSACLAEYLAKLGEVGEGGPFAWFAEHRKAVAVDACQRDGACRREVDRAIAASHEELWFGDAPWSAWSVSATQGMTLGGALAAMASEARAHALQAVAGVGLGVCGAFAVAPMIGDGSGRGTFAGGSDSNGPAAAFEEGPSLASIEDDGAEPVPVRSREPLAPAQRPPPPTTRPREAALLAGSTAEAPAAARAPSAAILPGGVSDTGPGARQPGRSVLGGGVSTGDDPKRPERSAFLPGGSGPEPAPAPRTAPGQLLGGSAPGAPTHQRTIPVSGAAFSTVLSRMGNLSACAVAVGKDSYTVSKSGAVIGPFTDDPSEQAQRVTAVLRAAGASERCKGR
jgi:hypothetical protein